MAEVTVQTDTPEATIVEPEKDEYAWLTERLDVHTLKLTEVVTECRKLAELSQSQTTAMREETRTLIEGLTSIVKTQSESLTTLAASATLSLTQQKSESSLPLEEVKETPVTTETVIPENAAPMLDKKEVHAAAEKQRKFRHL